MLHSWGGVRFMVRLIAVDLRFVSGIQQQFVFVSLCLAWRQTVIYSFFEPASPRAPPVALAMSTNFFPKAQNVPCIERASKKLGSGGVMCGGPPSKPIKQMLAFSTTWGADIKVSKPQTIPTTPTFWSDEICCLIEMCF